MSTIGQFPRTDSLLFNDRSFTCTLDLIDLVKQIQPFQKGWTLNPDVSRWTEQDVSFLGAQIHH